MTMTTVTVANAVKVALVAAAAVVMPPPPLDYEAWAVENLTFSERESPMPGPYNPGLFPYFSGILAALSPKDPCRIVTLSKSAQLGGTVLANVFVLGTLDMDPSDVLYVHPTEENARRWSRLKLVPMMRNTPAIAAAFPSRPRDGGDSVFFKERGDGRGSILISGANSPASLSQVSMRRQVQDDLAKWEINAAGDPESQADSRSQAYEFAKVFKISTPLVKPGCRITRNYEAGSRESYHVPCPHCGHMHPLEWENMLAQLDEAHPERAHFTCPDCGGVIEEHHRPEMIRGGRWVAENPSAARHHRSFYLWSAYSLLQSWERIARAWFAAKGDPAEEQVFLNDVVGRAYETLGEAPPWEALRDRASEAPRPRGIVPAGFPVLTLGVDCQKDRLEWQAVAWDRHGRRAVVEAGVIDGHVGEAATWPRLDQLVEAEWRTATGARLKVDRLAIDGNAWTEDVWGWAKRHPAGRVMMVRGGNQDTAPLLAKVKRERTRTGAVKKYSGRFFTFNASVLKMTLYRNLRKTDPEERGFVDLPRGLEDEFFRQLTAERRQEARGKDGFVKYLWVKDPAQANEALDTHLQAEVAAIRFGVRQFDEKTWDALELERGQPAEAQLDLEDIGPMRTAGPTVEAAPAGRGATGMPRRRGTRGSIG